MQDSGTTTASGAVRQYLPSAALFALVAALGCSKGEECTKARVEASGSWDTVRKQAGQAKLKGWIGFDDLSEAKKAEHVKLWTQLEAQAEMVFQSFSYERITWKTAEPAREQVNRMFDGYFAKENFPTFAAALKSANQKFEPTAKVCKE